MKDQRSSDEKLSGLLREWRVETPLPAGFEQGVWRRIDRQRAADPISPLDLAAQWVSRLFATPQSAGVFITALILIGATAGLTQGRRDVARVQDDLAQRYIQTLDPYQPQRPPL